MDSTVTGATLLGSTVLIGLVVSLIKQTPLPTWAINLIAAVVGVAVGVVYALATGDKNLASAALLGLQSGIAGMGIAPAGTAVKTMTAEAKVKHAKAKTDKQAAQIQAIAAAMLAQQKEAQRAKTQV